MENLDSTIISQYYTSPIIDRLIGLYSEAIGTQNLFQLFFSYIWNALNPDNPNPAPSPSWGLDIWGRIVVQPRIVTIDAFVPFRWSEAGGQGWGSGPWADFPVSTLNFVLSDPLYLLAILAKAATNITDCSVESINAIMLRLFPGRGKCYVIDGGSGVFPAFRWSEAGGQGWGSGPWADFPSSPTTSMTMTYVFEFPVTQEEAAVVQSGVLPKPAGVLASYDFAGGIS
jgi:hypothetical protein